MADWNKAAKAAKLSDEAFKAAMEAVGLEEGDPIKPAHKAHIAQALKDAGCKPVPTENALEALGLADAPQAPAQVEPQHVILKADKNPAEMRRSELLAALASGDTDADLLAEVEGRGLRVVVNVEGDGMKLDASATGAMWNTRGVLSNETTWDGNANLQIMTVEEWQRPVVLLCPISGRDLRNGVEPSTSTRWGADVAVLAAIRWAYEGGKLGNAGAVLGAQVWSQKKDDLLAEYKAACKRNPDLGARMEAKVRRTGGEPQTPQPHQGRAYVPGQLLKAVGDGLMDGFANASPKGSDASGGITINVAGSVSGLNVAGGDLTVGQPSAREDDLGKMLKMIPGQFALVPFYLNMPTNLLPQASQAAQAAAIVQWAEAHRKMDDLTEAVRRAWGR